MFSISVYWWHSNYWHLLTMLLFQMMLFLFLYFFSSLLFPLVTLIAIVHAIQGKGILFRNIQNTGRWNYSASGSNWVPIYWLGSNDLIFLPSWCNFPICLIFVKIPLLFIGLALYLPFAIVILCIAISICQSFARCLNYPFVLTRTKAVKNIYKIQIPP